MVFGNFGKKADSQKKQIDWENANHLIAHIDGILKMNYGKHDLVRKETGMILSGLEKMDEKHIKFKRLKALQLVSILASGGAGRKSAQYTQWSGMEYVNNAEKILSSLLTDIQREISHLKNTGIIDRKAFIVEKISKKTDVEINEELGKLDKIMKSRAHKIVRDLQIKDGVIAQEDRRIMILAVEIAERIDKLMKNLVAQEKYILVLLSTLQSMKEKTKGKRGITDFSDFFPRFRTYGAALKTLNDECNVLYEGIRKRAAMQIPMEEQSERIVKQMAPELLKVRKIAQAS